MVDFVCAYTRERHAIDFCHNVHVLWDRVGRERRSPGRNKLGPIGNYFTKRVRQPLSRANDFADLLKNMQMTSHWQDLSIGQAS